MVSTVKDPKKVRAGQIGARARWGDELRVIRLDTLEPPYRRLILAMVEAAKAAAGEPSGSGQG